jgi:serine/threonine protein phosphatase 1
MSCIADYIIGDVHGRADLLMALLNACVDDAFIHKTQPRFTFLGDVIDRGPRSRDCLAMIAEILRQYEDSLYIKGNHELMALAVLDAQEINDEDANRWLAHGGGATLESYGPDFESGYEHLKTFSSHHLELMRNASLSTVRQGYFLAHAGINPEKSLESQNETDLTRIRAPFLEHEGELPAIVIHGHTIVGERPQMTSNRISLDTGAYRTGRLTSCVISKDTVRFLQTDGHSRAVVEVSAERLQFDALTSWNVAA